MKKWVPPSKSVCFPRCCKRLKPSMVASRQEANQMFLHRPNNIKLQDFKYFYKCPLYYDTFRCYLSVIFTDMEYNQHRNRCQSLLLILTSFICDPVILHYYIYHKKPTSISIHHNTIFTVKTYIITHELCKICDDVKRKKSNHVKLNKIFLRMERMGAHSKERTVNVLLEGRVNKLPSAFHQKRVTH